MNKVILTARTTKQADLKVMNNDVHVAQFSIAVDEGKDREGNKLTSYFNCKAFNKTADFISRLNKGALIAICGKLHQDNYTDKNGVKKSNIEIIVESVDVIDWNERAEPKDDILSDPKNAKLGDTFEGEGLDAIEAPEEKLPFDD